MLFRFDGLFSDKPSRAPNRFPHTHIVSSLMTHHYLNNCILDGSQRIGQEGNVLPGGHSKAVVADSLVEIFRYNAIRGHYVLQTAMIEIVFLLPQFGAVIECQRISGLIK